MGDIRESIDRIVERGQRAYAAAGPPAPDSAFYARRARRAVRARAAALAAGGVAAAALAVLAVMAVLPRPGGSAEPAGRPGSPVWRSDVGSEMFGTPLVSEGRLYVGADDGRVRALDLADGSEAWAFDAGGPVRGAITTDGRLLFALADDGVLHAVRDGGTAAVPEWRLDLADTVVLRGVYDAYGSAPVVVGDALVLGTADGVVHAVSARDGGLLWSFRTGGPVRTSAAVGDGVVFVGSDDGFLYALDPATGAELWRHGFGQPVTASPGFHDGVVVAGSRGTEVRGLDAATGEVLWRHSLAPSWAEASPVFVDGLAVFGSSSAGMVTAVDARTGEERWQAFVRGWPWARPTEADGVVYAVTVLTGDAVSWPYTVYALDASTGTPLWQAATGDALEWEPDGRSVGALAGPVVADGLVVVAGLDGFVTAFAAGSAPPGQSPGP